MPRLRVSNSAALCGDSSFSCSLSIEHSALSEVEGKGSSGHRDRSSSASDRRSRDKPAAAAPTLPHVLPSKRLWTSLLQQFLKQYLSQLLDQHPTSEFFLDQHPTSSAFFPQVSRRHAPCFSIRTRSATSPRSAATFAQSKRCPRAQAQTRRSRLPQTPQLHHQPQRQPRTARPPARTTCVSLPPPTHNQDPTLTSPRTETSSHSLRPRRRGGSVARVGADALPECGGRDTRAHGGYGEAD